MHIYIQNVDKLAVRSIAFLLRIIGDLHTEYIFIHTAYMHVCDVSYVQRDILVQINLVSCNICRPTRWFAQTHMNKTNNNNMKSIEFSERNKNQHHSRGMFPKRSFCLFAWTNFGPCVPFLVGSNGKNSIRYLQCTQSQWFGIHFIWCV